MDARLRPLQWQGPSTPAQHRRPRSAFRASWSDTLDLLEHELELLKATDVVIEADFAERDIRLDGWPKANARQPAHPGVRIAFDSKHGPLVYATDSCTFWQHNVRSIGLGLEALRAVDRYGVTRRGEQYTGWRQIGAGPTSSSVFPVTSDAWDYLTTVVGADRPTTGSVSEDAARRRVMAQARRAAHPDTGGTQEAWLLVQDAIAAIEKAYS